MTPYFGAHGEPWKNFLPILYFGVMKSPSNATLFFRTGWGKKEANLSSWSKDHRLAGRDRQDQACLQEKESRLGGQPACLKFNHFPWFKGTMWLGTEDFSRPPVLGTQSLPYPIVPRGARDTPTRSFLEQPGNSETSPERVSPCLPPPRSTLSDI